MKEQLASESKQSRVLDSDLTETKHELLEVKHQLNLAEKVKRQSRNWLTFDAGIGAEVKSNGRV